MTLPLCKLTSYFSNHEEHIVKNLFIVTESVFEAKSTNLNQVKDKVGKVLANQDTTKPASNYRRLTRFFCLSEEEKKNLSKSLLCVCFCLLGLKGRKPKYLALDGTSWEIGTKKVHLLVLSVIINGVSIPICWEDLAKKGTSNYEERTALFDRASKWYDLSGMILLADREYIGEKWFSYLVNKGLHFVIRVKKSVYKEYVDTQRSGNYNRYFKHQKWRYIGLEREAYKKRYRQTGVSKQITIAGKKYTFVVFKNPKKEAKEALVYFISTLKCKKKIVTSYPIRWKIECCFKHLKSNGFNLEDLNLKDSEKIKLMMAIVCFLYVLCINEGLIAYKKMKKSDIKKYSDGSESLAVSIFRKGLAIVDGKFYHFLSFLNFLIEILKSKKKPKWVHVQ